MTFPNAVVLGVAKAGTTSLYHYLAQHPQVAVSGVREPKFLFYAGYRAHPAGLRPAAIEIRTPAQYEALFAGGAERPVRVDISPIYFAHPEQTILGIRQYVPEARLLVVFRQPVDRAYSAYVMHVREGNEKDLDFARVVSREGPGDHRRYLKGSFYAERTRLFLEAFPRGRLHFFLYDDLAADPAQFLRTVFSALGVDPRFSPSLEVRHNPGVWPARAGLHRVLGWRMMIPAGLRRLLPDRIRRRLLAAVRSGGYSAPPALDPGLRRELTELFRGDILALQDLIGRDLSGWLDPAGGGTAASG